MKKLLLIISILFFSGQNSFAQTPHFRNYTVDDGLPSSHVYRAFQDSKGFIWFCTDKGLARFDGYKFEKFTTKNGLPNNDVWHCAEDSEQRIWFLSYANAFFYFDLKDNKFHVISNPFKEYHDTHTACFIQEGKNNMKVIFNNIADNISIKLPNNIILKRIKKSIPVIKGGYPIEVDKTHIYYSKLEWKNAKSVKGNRGWTLRALSESFQHNLLHKTHVLPELKKIKRNFWEKVISIEFDDDKTIYGSNDSISYFKNKKFLSKPLRELSNYPNDILTLILSTGNLNKKLIITEKDIFIIDEKLERERSLDFIKDFNVNTIFFDSENNLWLCTKNQGIFLLSKKSIDSKVYDLSKQSINTLAKDKFNRVWMGTNTGKIYNIDHKKAIIQQRFSLEPKISIKKITTYDRNLSITWNSPMISIIPIDKLGGNKTLQINEISIYNNSEKIIHNANVGEILTGYSIKSLEFISENEIIMGSSGDMIKMFISKSSYRLKKYLPYTKIITVIPILKDVYIGTNKGLLKLSSNEKIERFDDFKATYPIVSKPISCFADDTQNALWTGTDGYGVYRFYKNHISKIPELDGMIINYLYSEKENNRIWVATNEGIFLLKLDLSLSTFRYYLQKISLAQGLPTLEVNCMVVRDNDLFVGTSKGLAILPIQNIIEAQSQSTPTPLIIKNIKINRQDETVSNYYNLNYRQNNLDIEFVALSFKSDKNIKYDYKMGSDNSDTLWHSVKDLHKEFSLLAPGKYEFSLRAFDIDGNPTQSVKPIIFVINSPFWDTIWFKILLILLILFLTIFYFYLRTRNIQKKEEEKTQINKKFAELELQALQAQMNPHFVFNALSAIQNFILNNDVEEATDYLSRFSRLMRLFLESSRNKYIALSEEKVLLEYYIQLEQLRFKDKFTYQIVLEEGVSLDTEIPSLLLQPFVENAINHGLVYKNTNDGYLNINFSKENNKLICIVEDNGIGRNEAAEIKNKSLKPYKSRGTEITEERLRSLEFIESTKIEIDIFDKIDENSIPQGTKVTIVMYL
jgi:ligand-binding sensor domain-containing protein